MQLRTRPEMINAGDLISLEVERVLQQLVHQALPLQIHVVEWNGTTGQIVDFQVRQSEVPVWLLYTPDHFSAIRKG